jgi:hypothetical protein
MKNRLLALAGALLLLLTLGRFFAKPLLAQVRAALVQNVDEPGRNPYQETRVATCGLNICDLTFATVPQGKRLVLTNVSGYTYCAFGADLPLGYVRSSGDNLQVFFPAEKGLVGAVELVFFNSEAKAYFGPGEHPLAHLDLDGTNHFTGDAQLTLTGYFVNLP